MRISNTLSLVCAASLCLGSLTAWADPDTEAQAKAREALRDPWGNPYIITSDTEAQAKAREALRKVLQQTPGAPSASAAPLAPVAPGAAPVSPAASETDRYGSIVMPPRAAPEIIEKAREALRQKMQESSAPADAAAAKPGKALPALKPLEGPASPLPATKQAALAELLKRYMADKITPREYQTERAKILSEP